MKKEIKEIHEKNLRKQNLTRIQETVTRTKVLNKTWLKKKKWKRNK